MKKLAGCLIVFAVTVFLTACGGGGASSSGGGNTYVPAPTPTPIANTTLSYYVPLAQGNTWTFATGAKMEDMGTMALSCSCLGNGVQMERIVLYSPGSNTISGSLFFTKTPPSGQFGRLTNLLGVENDADTNSITLASDSTYPNGVPFMDDQPSVNEFWSDTSGSSTITSVGGTMTLPNGQEIIDIATDQITGNFNPITWSFAKGVGFTGIEVGAQSTTITSFYVNTSTSQSGSRKPDSLRGITAKGRLGQLNISSFLTALFR